MADDTSQAAEDKALFPVIKDQAARLGRFWLFKRKRLAKALLSTLAGIEAQYEALRQQKADFEKSASVKRRLEREISDLQDEAEENWQEWQEKLDEAEEENSALQSKIKRVKQDYTAVCEERDSVCDERDAVIKALSAYKIVKDALAASDASGGNEVADKFQRLIEEDFRQFCSVESGANDVPPLLALQDVLGEMWLISQCPELYCKTVGAVGGRFSAGKSTFINSFIHATSAKRFIHLKEGTTPTTAIPSYIVASNEPNITGINYRGYKFDIAKETYESISHEMIGTFKFNLSGIIRHIMVSTPLDPHYFSSVCLMDTPGYAAPKLGTSETDYETSVQYIKNASFLIWLVNVTDGTLLQSDLEYLLQFDFGKRDDLPLYVVLTYANKRDPSDRLQTINGVATTLESRDIKYAGITVYESITNDAQRVYEMRGQGLFDFLRSHNKPNLRLEVMRRKVNSVFDEYEKFIGEDYGKKIVEYHNVMDVEYQAAQSGVISLSGDAGEYKYTQNISEIVDGNTGVKYLKRTLDALESNYVAALSDKHLKHDILKETLERRLEKVHQINRAVQKCIASLKSECDEAMVKDDGGVDRFKDFISRLPNAFMPAESYEQRISRLNSIRGKFIKCLDEFQKDPALT